MTLRTSPAKRSTQTSQWVYVTSVPDFEKKGSLLIQTSATESLKAFSAAIDDMFIYSFGLDYQHWWTPFELGKLYQYDSRYYRQFNCLSASLIARCGISVAGKSLPRSMIFTGTNHDNNQSAMLLIQGHSFIINPNMITESRKLMN